MPYVRDPQAYSFDKVPVGSLFGAGDGTVWRKFSAAVYPNMNVILIYGGFSSYRLGYKTSYRPYSQVYLPLETNKQINAQEKALANYTMHVIEYRKKVRKTKTDYEKLVLLGEELGLGQDMPELPQLEQPIKESVT